MQLIHFDVIFLSFNPKPSGFYYDYLSYFVFAWGILLTSSFIPLHPKKTLHMILAV